jgi:DNA (cytosine-5)-methyltransferase 1
MTCGSLFSGIGGFDLGFERAGFEIRWQVEIDDYATRVLARHWPHVRRYRDVRTVHGEAAHVADALRTGRQQVTSGAYGDEGAHEGRRASHDHQPASGGESGSDRLRACATCLAPVDVICGGFPCQPHSLAGRRGGVADERDLWPHFARLIRELRPRWVVAENVPGLLSSDAGRFFGTVLRDLAACGYDAEWDCLPASAFGAPHRRDRVWIVAYDASSIGGIQSPPARSDERALRRSRDASEILAYTTGERSQQAAERQESGKPMPKLGGAATVADTDGARCFEQCRVFTIRPEQSALKCRDWWRVEPDVGRVAHGVSARVDRLKGLGNAIVPQIAEWIARRILDSERVSV